MRAAVFTRSGDRDVIEVREVDDPVPGTDDVLVDVAYAGLNRADLLERRGHYGPPEPSVGPAIPGLEYAGMVAAVGGRVSKLQAGDRVFGIASGRAQAERIAVNAGTAMRIPDELPLEAAAAVPEAFMTAWDALFRAGRFRLGMTVVVHAAGSGVGLAALALAKAAGGTTVGTSRTVTKLERAAAHGLDFGALLDEDWPAVVRRVSGGRGADVVLDFIGAAAFDRNVAALAPNGRIVQIGTLGGASGSIALGPFMAKRASFIGTVLRARPLDEKIALTRGFEAEIVPLFARGILQPTIDRIFPLSEIREAHRQMEEDQNFGKILLKIR
jgi:NADPH:quinone reductase